MLIGNLIEQGARSGNGTVVTYNEESPHNPTQALYLLNNTLVHHRIAGGTFVRLLGTPTTAFTNNLFVGPGTRTSGTATEVRNLAGPTSWVVDDARLDVHLTASAGAIDVGGDPGVTPAGSAVGLTPLFQYVHPRAGLPRAVGGASIDVGAYEYGSAAVLDSGVVADAGNDSGAQDAAVDAVSTDASAMDVAIVDVGAVDVAADAVTVEGAGRDPAGGCGCVALGVSGDGRGVVALGVFLSVLASRRRARRDASTAAVSPRP